MSGERASLAAGGRGGLRGSRSASYGSLVRSPLSPVRQRRVEHRVQPGETLQGLAVKYGVSMEQIKRVNRLYTNESIFLKPSLWIPVLSDPGMDVGDAPTGRCLERRKPDEGREPLSAVDFLRRLDELISDSKQAAVRGCQRAEHRLAALDAACSGRTSAPQQSLSPSSRQGDEPLTKMLEDDVFQL